MIENIYFEAQAIAAQIIEKDLYDYALKNPLKLDKSLLSLVINQGNFNNKIKRKVDAWAAKGLIAPPKVSLEQSSSEFTADFKAQIVRGKKLLDLTGGFGVDSYFFSKYFEKVIYNERNIALANIVAHNFKTLNAFNIEVKKENAESLVENLTERFDVIYLDPARRNATNQKMVNIEDCEPNLISLKNALLLHSETVLVKYSPLLDLKLAIRTLQNVSEIYILAEKNEVKEVLLRLKSETTENPKIFAINQSGKTIESFTFDFVSEEQTSVNFDFQGNYLYEPNAAILKAGAFKSIAKQFNINKLASNSHLYLSDTFLPDFQGKKFKITTQLKFDKKQILEKLPHKKANIICRNFGKTPDEVRKYLKISDGGDDYLILTENHLKEKVVFLAIRI